MNKYSIILLCLLSPLFAISQTVFGKWKTVDDDTGEVRSIVEVFERAGMAHGRVIKLYRKPGEDPDPICKECDEDDPRFNQKVIGMEIMKNMAKDGDEYSGEVLDPENGKVYRGKIWLEGKDLRLRGYIGPFFRTQTWIKAE